MATPRERRLVVEVVLAVLAVGLLALIGERLLRSPPAPAVPVPAPVVRPTEPPATAPEAAVHARLVGVRGKVERRGSGEGWVPAATGDALRSDESIRTAAGGQADLQVDEHSKMTITDSSEVTVQEVSQALHRFKLVRGRIAVDYRSDGARRLRIEGQGSDAVAETSSATFSMLSNGVSVAVASDQGTVNLMAAGKAVEVRAGEQSVVAGGEPSAPAKISAAVMLQVANAAARSNPTLCALLTGTVAPGTEVWVDDRAIPVTTSGGFSFEVPMQPGQREVKVSTRTVTGKSEQRMVACNTRVHGTIKHVEVNWGE